MFLFGRLKSDVRHRSGKPHCIQRTQLWGKGTIVFGNDVRLGYFPSPYLSTGMGYLDARMKSARIEIGDRTVLNNNAVIIARSTEIVIGADCCIGYNFQCIDSDFHGLRVEARNDSQAIVDEPVHIGDSVFIGSNVLVLKGVTLGEGCVVAAGSVVTKSFPPRSIIGGNPARLIRMLP